jgi:dynein assembly factor with WDR repeat domains 1
VVFNSQGSLLLTASMDNTAKIWDVETGKCLQTLGNHTDEIFSCLFNYDGIVELIIGDSIITGSKDNTVNIWNNILI